MRTRRERNRQASCPHDTSISTVFAGIRRDVCESCGWVSVSHQEEVVTNGMGIEPALAVSA